LRFWEKLQEDRTTEEIEGSSSTKAFQAKGKATQVLFLGLNQPRPAKV
jgi:hypothetical protein